MKGGRGERKREGRRADEVNGGRGREREGLTGDCDCSLCCDLMVYGDVWDSDVGGTGVASCLGGGEAGQGEGAVQAGLHGAGWP